MFSLDDGEVVGTATVTDEAPRSKRRRRGLLGNLQVGLSNSEELFDWWKHVSTCLPQYAMQRVERVLQAGVALSSDYSGISFFEATVERMCTEMGAPQPRLLHACDIDEHCRRWLLRRERAAEHVIGDLTEKVRGHVLQRMRRVQVAAPLAKKCNIPDPERDMTHEIMRSSCCSCSRSSSSNSSSSSTGGVRQ